MLANKKDVILRTEDEESPKVSVQPTRSFTPLSSAQDDNQEKSVVSSSRLRPKADRPLGEIARTIKEEFPIFKNRGNKFIYLDSASTSQKPQAVIDAVANFYAKHNSNVHRGIYTLSEEATSLYEGARDKVAKFISASSTPEVVFTSNTNESINLVVFGWAKKFLQEGDYVVLSEMEHHANIVPWQRLRDEIGIKLYHIPFDEQFRLQYHKLLTAIPTSKIKVVSLTHVSNVLGTINPIKEIVQFLDNNDIKARVIVDAAQSAPHLPLDVQDLGCDFLAFSGHKMLGPSGIGVLWGKQELLEEMDPLVFGSHMISQVTKDTFTYAELPWKFEPGTGHLEAAVGLGAAIDYLSDVGFESIMTREQELVDYTLQTFKQVIDLQLYGPTTVNDRLGVFSFNVGGVHAHDVAEILNRTGVCVRSGHHCAQPLMQVLDVPATVRASLYLYNDKRDIDKFVEGLLTVRSILQL